MLGESDLLLGLLLGIALGASIASVIFLYRRGHMLSALHEARARAEYLENSRQQLQDSFRSVGSATLAEASRQFLDLANERFDKLMTEARGDADKRQESLHGMLEPMRNLLDKHQQAVREIENKREVAYEGLEQQIKTISQVNKELHQETGRLASALRRPDHRGRWGELQLRNAVELAGMTAHCDFSEQATLRGEDRTRRPDMLVKLPGKGVVPVDAKVPLEAYLDAIEAPSEHKRNEAYRKHLQRLEAHVQQLSSRRYSQIAEKAGLHTSGLVVLFIPIESALTVALEIKPDLHAAALEKNVLIATPMLLIALLRSIAHGWQQEDLALNAQEIAKAGKELYERLAKFADHFDRIGRSLDGASTAYNEALGSMESRLLPTARKLRELHATRRDEIATPRRADAGTRRVTAAELEKEEIATARQATTRPPPDPTQGSLDLDAGDARAAAASKPKLENVVHPPFAKPRRPADGVD